MFSYVVNKIVARLETVNKFNEVCPIMVVFFCEPQIQQGKPPLLVYIFKKKNCTERKGERERTTGLCNCTER